MLDLYLKIILYHVLNVVKIFELLSKVKKTASAIEHKSIIAVVNEWLGGAYGNVG
jgi:hypothetical protein